MLYTTLVALSLALAALATSPAQGPPPTALKATSESHPYFLACQGADCENCTPFSLDRLTLGACYAPESGNIVSAMLVDPSESPKQRVDVGSTDCENLQEVEGTNTCVNLPSWETYDVFSLVTVGTKSP